MVAAESFWGSIAAQLGGGQVQVQNIIANPATDPHSYEPTASDASLLAEAQLAIVNGSAYDEWASRLLAANPLSGRLVLNAGSRLGLRGGANPHQWYSPPSVLRMVAAISAAYTRLRPAERSYFEVLRRTFLASGLARYRRLLAEIGDRFAGAPVGYSESIFEPLGRYLRLRLLTPRGYAKLVAEGAEVGPADQRRVEDQVRRHAIGVWIYNKQDATPEVQRINDLARAAGVPIVTVTETLSPAGASFQQWQAAQLQELLQALQRAARGR